jgi:hypothetical protein
MNPVDGFPTGAARCLRTPLRSADNLLIDILFPYRLPHGNIFTVSVDKFVHKHPRNRLEAGFACTYSGAPNI